MDYEFQIFNMCGVLCPAVSLTRDSCFRSVGSRLVLVAWSRRRWRRPLARGFDHTRPLCNGRRAHGRKAGRDYASPRMKSCRLRRTGRAHVTAGERGGKLDYGYHLTRRCT